MEFTLRNCKAAFNLFTTLSTAFHHPNFTQMRDNLESLKQEAKIQVEKLIFQAEKLREHITSYRNGLQLYEEALGILFRAF